MRNIVELNTSFELANPVKDDVTIKDQAKFKQMVEICSALFTGTDAGKYGTQKDAVRELVKQVNSSINMCFMSLRNTLIYGWSNVRNKVLRVNGFLYIDVVMVLMHK